jgi:hypothetical protein
MDLLLVGYGQPRTRDLLGEGNDVIVPAASQLGDSNRRRTISGIDHVEEPRRTEVHLQLLEWLLAPTPDPQAASPAVLPPVTAPDPAPASAPWNPDLTGYATAPESAVAFSPPSGATVPVLQTSTVKISSPNKQIAGIVVLSEGKVTYLTSAPYQFTLQPLDIGAAEVLVVVVFSDRTLRSSRLRYSVAPSGNLLNVSPRETRLDFGQVGDQLPIDLLATYETGQVHVGANASYTTGSGTSSVVAVDKAGVATAIGRGADVISGVFGGNPVQVLARIGGCTYGVSSSSPTLGAGDGTVAARVNTDEDCQWFATADAPWIQVSSGSGGMGPGTAVLQVAANSTNSSRVGGVWIGDRKLWIAQSAAGCTFSVTGLLPIPVSPVGGVLTLVVTAGTGCFWSASTQAGWISANSVGANSGAGAVVYSLAANCSTNSRTGTIEVAGQVFTVTQMPGAGCALTNGSHPSPASENRGGGFSSARRGCVAAISSR